MAEENNERERWEGEQFRLLVENVKDYAIFILDTEGRVQTWSVGGERLLGYREDEIVGQPFSRFFTESDVAKGEPEREMGAALQAGRGFDDRWHVRKDGSLFWCSGVMTPLKDRDGTLRGFAKIMRDLTEQKLHEEYRRQSEERFQLLVENVTDYAIYMLDPEGHVATWNEGAERLKGYKADEVVGKHFSVFYTPEDRQAGRPERNLEGAKTHGRFRDTGLRLRKDGTRFLADVAITALHDASGKLRGYGKVTHDVTERRRYEEELAAANRRKDEFLAMLGHELRNPLAPMANRLAALERNPSVTADVRDQLDGIRRHMVQLVRLLDDLLDIGRISTGKILLRRRRMDLGAAIDLALEMVSPYIDGRRHRLHRSLPDQILAVDGDVARLAQVFANLLNNAAKFTEPGGNIWIEADRDGQHALVRVKDDGVGIARETLPRIFQPFYQADASPDRTREGMGVGLALARDLVQLHGGSIDARSEGAGRGAEFMVRLPLTEAVEPAKVTKGRPSAAARRVLIVDDNRDAGQSLAAVLRLDGHEALAVTSGEAALKTLDSYRPDAMLLDLAMPVMNGYELAEHIRKRPEFADCLLIAVSGYGQDHDKRRSKDAGFDGHLVKPVDFALLADRLASGRRHDGAG